MPLPVKPHVSLHSHTGRSFFQARISRRFAKRLLISSLTLFALSTLAGIWLHARSLSRRGDIGHEFLLAPGPWGRIHARTVLLHPPAGIFDPDFQLGDGKWYFKSQPPPAIATLLRDCGFSERHIATLLPTLAPVPSSPQLAAITPPAEIVLALDKKTRSRLYRHLAGLDANFAQAHPFRMATRHVDQWLQGSDLDPATIDLVRQLLWESGSTTMLSDYNLVAARIDDPSQRVALQRLLSRKASLRAWLEIQPDTDLRPLADYWSARGRAPSSLHILQAASTSGTSRIDLIELLPPFARRHLNRFPDLRLHATPPPACHWSTFNFFTTGQPDDAFHTAEAVEQTLRHDHHRIPDAPRFGDIVLLNEPDGTSIHSAILIADDTVFTKNGPSISTPWILATIEEMKAFYPGNKHLTVAFHRHTGHQAASPQEPFPLSIPSLPNPSQPPQPSTPPAPRHPHLPSPQAPAAPPH